MNINDSIGYIQRLTTLKALGFDTYSDYLESDLWKVIRELILKRDKFLCQSKGCTNKAIQVHHLAYTMNVMIGRNPGLLVSLCRECHESCELDNGVKRDFALVQKVLFEMVSGLKRTRAISNKRIGDWYRERSFDQANHKIRIQIKGRLSKRIPHLWYRIAPHWEEKVGTSELWSAPPVDKKSCQELLRLVKTSYPEITVIDLTKRDGGYKLLVTWKFGNRTVWTKEQIEYLYQKYKDKKSVSYYKRYVSR